VVIQRWSDRWTEAVDRLEARGAVLRVGIGALRAVVNGDASTLACAMAFQFFLALLPLLALATWALSWLTTGDDALLLHFASVLELAPEAARDLVESHRVTFPQNLAPVAALGAFWLASEPFHGMMTAFEERQTSVPRSWLRRRAIAFGCVVGLVLALGAAVSLSLWLEASALVNLKLWATDAHTIDTSSISAAALVATSSALILYTLLLSAFFRVGIRSPHPTRHTLLGSAIAVLLTAGASWGFAFYVRTLSRYALYYGSLAAVVVVLLWLWLCSFALLLGAEVNAQLERSSPPHPKRPAL
jgi:membrane protein